MDRKYLAFDVETAKILPDRIDDLKAHRPLGITCAAIQAEDDDEPHLRYSCTADGSPAPQMSRGDLVELVSYLTEQVARGYTIVTWNGAGFDFDILAEESGRWQDCRDLAINHVDMMFVVHCVKGFPVSLEAASAGIGSQGRPHGMSGANAPRLWTDGEARKVLAYAANDCAITLQIAKFSEHRKRFSWVTRAGSKSNFPLPSGRWLTVAEANQLPKPDTSWMTEKPLRRTRFTSWFESSLPAIANEYGIINAKKAPESSSSIASDAVVNRREFSFDVEFIDPHVHGFPEVGDYVSFWAPRNNPEAVVIYRRGSLGGSGKIGVVPGRFVSRIARHLASGLPFDTEVQKVSASSCFIRCSLTSAEEVEAAKTKAMEKLRAELRKPYRPRKPIVFSIDA